MCVCFFVEYFYFYQTGYRTCQFCPCPWLPSTADFILGMGGLVEVFQINKLQPCALFSPEVNSISMVNVRMCCALTNSWSLNSHFFNLTQFMSLEREYPDLFLLL